MLSPFSISEGGKNLMNRVMKQLPDRVDLVNDEQVALLFHEIGIRSGYRQPGGSWAQYAGSCFYPLHNETINIWTHFVPFVFNLWMLVQLLSDVSFISDVYHWPFLVYVLSCCLWPLVSCLAHIFGSMSLRARHLCFLADYAALSQYSFGVAVAYHAYSFDRRFLHTSVTSYFPLVAACAAVLCICMSGYSRIMCKTLYWRRKIVRSMAFFIPYVFVNIPLVMRLWWHVVHDTNEWSPAVLGHLRQFLFIIIAFTFYTVHCPERLLPGRFDYIGHSHQVFHVFGAFATYFQIHAIHHDLDSLRSINMQHEHTTEVLMFVGVLLVNILVVYVVFSIAAPAKHASAAKQHDTSAVTEPPATDNEKHTWQLPHVLMKLMNSNQNYFNVKLWMVRNNKTD